MIARYLIAVILVVVGLINLSPIIGVLSAEQLSRLYGIAVDDPDLIILLRHRAVLFGLLGTFIIASAFRPSLQLWACVAGLVSMVTFIGIAYSVGEYGAAIGTVVIADVVASAGLVVVLLLRALLPGNATGRET
ncbi:MAG: phosphopantetheine adenylyltransferase [Gammaproteobacteria bacterium]|nr:phosphopantetheine adenylyltransferase [Gammaproteobacteria bacterium]